MKYTYLFLALLANLILYFSKMTEIQGLHPNMGVIAAIYILVLLTSMAITEGPKIGYWFISMLCLFTSAIWATKITVMPIATSAIMLACLACVWVCHLKITEPAPKTVDLSPLADAMEKKAYWKHQDEKDKPTEADCWDGDESDKFLQ